MAPGAALVPRQLPVLHDPDRVHRPVARAVARLDDRGRRSGILVGTVLHGPPRDPGPDARAAADDPVARPVRVPRRHRRAVRDGVHLHGVQRRRPGAAGPGPARGVRLEREPGRDRGHRGRRCPGDLRLRLGAPGLPLDPVHPAAAGGHRHDRRDRRQGRRRAQPHVYGFNWTGFMSQFSAAAAYNITYAGYVSDYSRYLPRNTSRGKIIGYVFAGASTPADLADRARRLARHPARRDRRPGRPADRGQQRDQPPRRDHRLPVGLRAGRDHGHERLRRQPDGAGRGGRLPEDQADPQRPHHHHPGRWP